MFSVSSDVTISGCSHRYKTRRISCSVWTYQKSWNLERDSLVATTSLLQLISEHFRYFIWRSSKTRTLAYYQLSFYKVFQTIYPDLNFFFFFMYHCYLFYYFETPMLLEVSPMKTWLCRCWSSFVIPQQRKSKFLLKKTNISLQKMRKKSFQA